MGLERGRQLMAAPPQQQPQHQWVLPREQAAAFQNRQATRQRQPFDGDAFRDVLPTLQGWLAGPQQPQPQPQQQQQQRSPYSSSEQGPGAEALHHLQQQQHYMQQQQQQGPPQGMPGFPPPQQQRQFEGAADPVIDPACALPGLRATSGALAPIGAGLDSLAAPSSSMQQPQQVRLLARDLSWVLLWSPQPCTT